MFHNHSQGDKITHPLIRILGPVYSKTSWDTHNENSCGSKKYFVEKGCTDIRIIARRIQYALPSPLSRNPALKKSSEGVCVILSPY